MSVVLRAGGSGTPSTSSIGASGLRVMTPTASGSGTGGLTAGTERTVPFFVGAPTSYDRIGVNVTSAGTAGTTVRLGVRSPISGTNMPGALFLDAGAIDGTSVSYQEVVMALSLSPGVWWLSVLPLVGNPTISVTSSGLVLPSVSANPIAVNLPRAYNGTAGQSGFPTNFGTPVSENASGPLIVMRQL